MHADPTTLLAIPAAEIVASASLASFFAAAGTSFFSALIYNDGPEPSALDLSQTADAATILGEQNAMGHDITIASTDRRIVSLGEISVRGL